MPPAAARRVLAVLLLLLALSVSALAQESAVAPKPPQRPAALVPLYVSFGALQVAHAASTFRALDRGAVEANPLLGGIASNRGELLTVKAASSAGIILASEKLRRRNRVAAIALMAGLNGAYAMVVVHNRGAVR